MSDFNPRSLCILGRQPALGLAELERLYGSGHIQPIAGAALLDIDVNDIAFRRLGGTIKLAKILTILPTTNWGDLEKYLHEAVPHHLKYVPESKFTLGLSSYNLNISPKTINRTLINIKKRIRSPERPVRVVPNKDAALNSAQVLHNKLTSQGAWELLLVGDGNQTVLAQTMFIQDIEAYAARDQARPKRDPRVGMLPPKLAQIMVNLAVGTPDIKSAKGWDKRDGLVRLVVFDPFCGTGVILQEALLMGFSVYGSDIEARMIDYSRTNLQWLVKINPQIQGRVALEVADATKAEWPRFSHLASELFLGPPLNKIPTSSELDKIATKADNIVESFLRNLAAQITPQKSKICLALPAWRLPGGKFKHLPVLDKLTDMGYNYLDLKHVERTDLLYYREDQIVARQLIVLEKS